MLTSSGVLYLWTLSALTRLVFYASLSAWNSEFLMFDWGSELKITPAFEQLHTFTVDAELAANPMPMTTGKKRGPSSPLQVLCGTKFSKLGPSTISGMA